MTETKDRPTVEEQYITAEGGRPIIAAAALASIGENSKRVSLALMLWSVTYEGRSERKKELAEALGRHLNEQMAQRRRLKGDAWKIAKEMLAWHLHGVCTECDGRKYVAIQGTPSLSDNLCPHCQGTGKRPYPREAAHSWLVGEIESLTALASGEVMKRLNERMTL
ncbi:hypothetical protein [Hydrogenophaga laconesensis]|uniref:Uncharacterized protein n=1 Tax=Hydrogenophaga laconesensis TaxID=1805971 RepID=A0ABU1V9N4_9BURK|nr:hypothetical protein [Hydrogenophaga laconesensis]MDR7094140.1 hypothetical protein [Hydrogenophaga laconesensis]